MREESAGRPALRVRRSAPIIVAAEQKCGVSVRRGLTMTTIQFCTSDVLHLVNPSAEGAIGWDRTPRVIVIVHRDKASLYKSTKKARRTGLRAWSSVVGCPCEIESAYEISTPGQKTNNIRLQTEFGDGKTVSVVVSTRELTATKYTSGEKEGVDWHDDSGAPGRDRSLHPLQHDDEGLGYRTPGLNLVFIDVNAILESESHDCNDRAGSSREQLHFAMLMETISSLTASSFENAVIHTRSDVLSKSIASINEETKVVPADDLKVHIQDTLNGQSRIRRLGEKILSANCPLSTHPARYIEVTDGDGNISLKEICRFHNYDKRGCLRLQRERCDCCHKTCYRCGTACGSRGFECVRADADLPSGDASVVFKQELGGKVTWRHCEPTIGTEIQTPALLVLGGRLRGRTLATCEMLPLGSQEGGWLHLPNLHEHRGSHAAACPQGSSLVFVSGGGGVDGNLDSTEVLSRKSTGKWWTMKSPLSSPRHAFGAVSIRVDGGISRIFSVGGWKYGSLSCGSVERLTLNDDDYESIDRFHYSATWEPCASLILPRRLHSTAASSDGKFIYVFGGYATCTCTTKSIERYDIEADAWEDVASLPSYDLVQAIAHEDAFLIFPFAIKGSEGPSVLRYIPGKGEGDAFHKVLIPGSGDELTLPVPGWHSFAVTVSKTLKKVYLVGGTIESKWTERSFELDLSTMAWRELPKMSSARRRLATVVME